MIWMPLILAMIPMWINRNALHKSCHITFLPGYHLVSIQKRCFPAREVSHQVFLYRHCAYTSFGDNRAMPAHGFWENTPI